MKRRVTSVQLSNRSGREADEGRICLWLAICCTPAKDMVGARFCRRSRALCLDILGSPVYLTPRISKCDR
jgi:hypothetical protein